LKILYFSRDYCPHDYRFLKAIHDIGHEVFFLRLENSGRNLESRELPEAVHEAEWRWREIPYDPRNADAILSDLKEIFDQIQPDVIHSGPLTDVSWLTAEADLHPHAAMSWGFDLMHDIEADPRLKQNAAIALHQADWFLGDCYVERDTAIPLGLKKDHATIFPWGIDPKQFCKGSSAVRRELAEEDEFLLLSTRSLEPNYRVDITLSAFIVAAAKEPKLKLAILADGSQFKLLRNIADAAPKEIRDRILWLGRKPNDQLIDYYRAADLYLSASITDGSSVSLLEAMACEIPVLVSDIPGNLEWVEDGRTGFLFKTGDSAQMADKILFCYRNRGEMQNITAPARRLIEEKADWEKNKYRLTEAYRNAVTVCNNRYDSK